MDGNAYMNIPKFRIEWLFHVMGFAHDGCKLVCMCKFETVSVTNHKHTHTYSILRLQVIGTNCMKDVVTVEGDISAEGDKNVAER